jgi:hypothetical protein
MQMPISAARKSLSIGSTRNDDASIAHSAGTIPKARIFLLDMIELRSGFQSRRWDSNPRPFDYKSKALPTELHRRGRVLRGGPDRLRRE